MHNRRAMDEGIGSKAAAALGKRRRGRRLASKDDGVKLPPPAQAGAGEGCTC